MVSRSKLRIGRLLAASVLLLLSSVTAAIAIQVGDCLPLTQESPARCIDVVDCETAHPAQTCYASSYTCNDGSCGTGACLAAVQHDNRKRGKCGYGPLIGNPTCSHCGIYYCALNRMYRSINSDNQCQGPSCFVHTYQSDVCVPPP